MDTVYFLSGECCLIACSAFCTDLGKTKVQNLGLAPFGDENVCRLYVSVDDAFGMGSVQSIGNFDSRTEQRFKLHRPSRDGVFQCFALQTFHRDEAPAVLLADFVNGADVRMIQCRGGTSLAAETFKSLRVF